jgi:uncharacterized protein YifN (PemK superfamily)
MGLNFHPSPGTILVCDYGTGFIKPEMVKRRPVVVISPRLRNRNNLCAVVPLSTTPPDKVMPYHCEIRLNPPLPPPWTAESVWVKADMLATVSFERLDLIKLPRIRGEGRNYLKRKVDSADLMKIHLCIINSLGLDSLIKIDRE